VSAQLLIYGFAPLLVYILVDYWKGFRAGVLAAIVVSLFVLTFDYIQTRSFDFFVVGETSLIVALGYVSLKMNKDRYFKFQPAVVGAIFSAIFAYFQFFDKPLLVLYIPRIEQFLLAGTQAQPADAEVVRMLELLKEPAIVDMFGRMSGACILLFLAHSMLMVYAALRCSTGAWFAWRLAIYPALIGLTVYYQLTLGA
jgi:hypothetical protein